MDLRNIDMGVEMNGNNDVKPTFYATDKNGKKTEIDISKLSEREKKYVATRFTLLLKETANAWPDIFGGYYE